MRTEGCHRQRTSKIKKWNKKLCFTIFSGSMNLSPFSIFYFLVAFRLIQNCSYSEAMNVNRRDFVNQCDVNKKQQNNRIKFIIHKVKNKPFSCVPNNDFQFVVNFQPTRPTSNNQLQQQNDKKMLLLFIHSCHSNLMTNRHNWLPFFHLGFFFSLFSFPIQTCSNTIFISFEFLNSSFV